MIIGRNQVMEKSNLTSRFDNHDYDGDNLIALALHSEQAKADFKHAYVRNLVEFEHLDELLLDYEHESIFSSYMLTLISQNQIIPPLNDIPVSLRDTVFSLDDFKVTPGQQHIYSEFPDHSLTMVEAAINKVLLENCSAHMEIPEPIYLIERDGLLTKKNLTNLSERFWVIVKEINSFQDTEILNFWDIIHEFDKFLLECGSTIDECNPSFELQDFSVGSPEITEFKENLISTEPFIAFHQNLILFEKVSKLIEINPDNILNEVFKSGARLKSVQLLKAASNTGIPTDIYGKAFPANIKNSLLDGLTPKEYFITGDSARLALAVRQEAIPKGGELQRKFFFATGILKLDREVNDCQHDIPIEDHKTYPIVIKNKNHLKLMNHRFYRYIQTDGSWVSGQITIETETGDIPTEYLDLIGTEVEFYSPVSCVNSNYKICKKCFGEKLPTSVNLGSLVGAAISEGIIQSVLRTHHFGGSFIATEDHKLMDILRGASFQAPDTVILPDDNVLEDNLKYIVEYLAKIYKEDEIKISTSISNNQCYIKLDVIELPFNDDAVKQLNNIVGLIDKNRDAASMIDPKELYQNLQIIIEQNGILSTYLELIISLLYYDDDGILMRYSNKLPSTQIALKNIIETIDPKLNIFYNFSNRIISKIYNHTAKEEVDHMYHDLLEVYY